MFGDIRRIHFVGIGGIGMSGLARILLQHGGFQVSGSDLHDSPSLDGLRAMGARIHVGHGADNLQDAQAVVYSSAISYENQEIQEARNRSLPLVHRSELLAELMRFKEGITITGTHGKTTTTAFCGLVLQESGLDPTVVVGANVQRLGGNARYGKGRYFVAEADESDRSFLKLRPLTTVITNIDLDHMDVYRNLDDLKETFLQHIHSIPFYGTVILCRDDPHLRSLQKNVHRRMLTYGLSTDSDIQAQNLELKGFKSSYQCVYENRIQGQVRLNVGGEHNVVNSLAAIAMGRSLGLDFATIAAALERFEGAERRLEWKGEKNGVVVIDDYGHHPAEIRASLTACKQVERRIVLVFQPHRYTRTQHLMDSLAESFDLADELYLLDIYAAGETPIHGVTSEVLADRVASRRPVTYVRSFEEALERLNESMGHGDLLLTMGAGNVWRLGERFLEEDN